MRNNWLNQIVEEHPVGSAVVGAGSIIGIAKLWFRPSSTRAKNAIVDIIVAEARRLRREAGPNTRRKWKSFLREAGMNYRAGKLTGKNSYWYQSINIYKMDRYRNINLIFMDNEGIKDVYLQGDDAVRFMRDAQAETNMEPGDWGHPGSAANEYYEMAEPSNVDVFAYTFFGKIGKGVGIMWNGGFHRWEAYWTDRYGYHIETVPLIFNTWNDAEKWVKGYANYWNITDYSYDLHKSKKLRSRAG